jgi:DNA invertase Pin-like site-specific DNA recombinase
MAKKKLPLSTAPILPAGPVCHLYGRVSAEDQLLGMSLEKQVFEGWRFYDYKLEPQGVARGEAFQERAVSAYKVDFLKRPEGMRLNLVLRPGDHVVILRFDRAFRNVLDFLNVWKSWDIRDIILHVLDQPMFDMSTAQGVANAQMMAVFAEHESRMKSQRLREMAHFNRMQGFPAIKVRKGRAWDFPGIKMRQTAKGKSFPEFEPKSFATYRYMLQIMAKGEYTWDELCEHCEKYMCEQVGVPYMQSAFHQRRWITVSSMHHYYMRRKELIPMYERMGLDFPEGLLEMPERYNYFDRKRAKVLHDMDRRLPSYLRNGKAS